MCLSPQVSTGHTASLVSSSIITALDFDMVAPDLLTFSKRDFVKFLQLPIFFFFSGTSSQSCTEKTGTWNVMFRINIPRARPGLDSRKGSASLVMVQPMKRSTDPNLLASGRHFGSWGTLAYKQALCLLVVFAALCRRKLYSLEYFVHPSCGGKEWVCKLPGFGAT